jgi:uncharacterized protein (TIGR03663 family)
MQNNTNQTSWLDRPLSSILPALTPETLLFLLILLLATFSRLYNLGVRAVSHDETSHIFYSWQYAHGLGYQHTPTTHGPLQFHLVALSFLLFGDNEFTARLPHAIASILTILLLWNWRRYLGRAGTLVAAGLMLISPYMLSYGRYARNEAFVALLGVLTLYSILRYFELGKNRYLYLLVLATALHFTAKETAFIYTAQALIYLAFFLVLRIARKSWTRPILLKAFLAMLAIGILIFGAGIGISIFNRSQPASDALQTVAPSIPGQTIAADAAAGRLPPFTLIVAIGLLAFLVAVILLILGYGWENLRRERAFDMLVLLGTFVLPQLAPFVANAFGWNPLDYAFTWPGWNLAAIWAQVPARTAAVLLVLAILSVILGLLWDKKRWLISAALFWVPYTLLYTSLLTNWQGFFTGVVGSLGYWLAQQGVQRGGQPWYYYTFIQIPLYEFLPAIGVLLAAWYGFRRREPAPLPRTEEISPLRADDNHLPSSRIVFSLLLWWWGSSLVAFSLAGEKMPWLTVHIALPMILLAGWGFGQLFERFDWSHARGHHLLPATLLIALLITSLARCLILAAGMNAPFQGKTLDQLTATGSFLFSAALCLGSLASLAYLLKDWQSKNTLRLTGLVLLGLLAGLTIRTSIRAAFQHPNEASEYMVYAHAASGVTDLMDQVSLISSRIYGETNIPIAFDRTEPDAGVGWPFIWYLRYYPHAKEFSQVSSDLLNFPVVIADQRNADSVAGILGADYTRSDYIRLVWPNQDYFALTWGRIKAALTDPRMRSALLAIWLNRDFTEYGLATGETSLTAANWQPSDRMSLFVRSDVLDQIWDFPSSPHTTVRTDPYADGQLTLASDLVIGTAGNSNGQFNHPHGLAIAPDGSLFVADTDNNRIQHFSPEGQFLNAWGVFGDISTGADNAPIGTFNQPWAVAVSPDGRWVYVADTWNHRIQKFSSSGEPMAMWGVGNYDPASTNSMGLWGPRGIVVDPQNRVFVADTGNKRVLVYDSDGGFLFQIGTGGMEVGQFEEPVGLALDAQDNLYVADTWNQRIQVFSPSTDGFGYSPAYQWDVSAWYGEALDNKPYLAVSPAGQIYITDPSSFRVIEFDASGTFVQAWGDYGDGAGNFGLPSGIAVDSQGRVWVSDPVNDRILHFQIP